jgi:hypothetical protein
MMAVLLLTTTFYAAAKVATVRELERTSAPIVHAGGRVDAPKRPPHIIGGLLTTRCDWSSLSSAAFDEAIRDQLVTGRLDIGCAVQAGGWRVSYGGERAEILRSSEDRSIVFFLFQLLARLQSVGTAPAMDYDMWSVFLAE